ncbi:hypothetical protein [Dyadobacter aurulentus]|uniref:hypothetical protein n=1 Tax=Dyadobacter sp. UC 10 TaxID=2605428 RepID=UPI0011F09F95|nr:hypothetical protein [Dyadobacter sp. UC 10]KAA0993304.1 hypothetical protein FXO21_25575 [Dyadobacter sp. UC 10]
MKRLYKYSIISQMVFAIGHIIYTPIAHASLNEPAVWFFSGALTLLLSGFLNYMNLVIPDRILYRVTALANFLLVLFTSVLAFVVPEPQCIALVFANILLLIFGLTGSAFSRPEVKRFSDFQ